MFGSSRDGGPLTANAFAVVAIVAAAQLVWRTAERQRGNDPNRHDRTPLALCALEQRAPSHAAKLRSMAPPAPLPRRPASLTGVRLVGNDSKPLNIWATRSICAATAITCGRSIALRSRPTRSSALSIVGPKTPETRVRTGCVPYQPQHDILIDRLEG